MLERLLKVQFGLIQFFVLFFYYSVPGAELMLVVAIMLGPRGNELCQHVCE